MGNVAPAYFEYVGARLSGGHLPEWRGEGVDVLRGVLGGECEREVARWGEAGGLRTEVRSGEELFREALDVWNALVDVERSA